MRRYAVLEVDLLRGKIIRRNVCTAVAVHTRRSCFASTAFDAVLYRFLILYFTSIMASSARTDYLERLLLRVVSCNVCCTPCKPG